jgi:putative transposase
LTGASRSGVRHESKSKPGEEQLRQSIRQEAHKNKRYGYRRIHAVLCRKGMAMNQKKCYRLWREEGLQVPKKARRKRCGHSQGEPEMKASRKNQVWSYDFLEERTCKGQKVRMLTVLDEFTRESLGIFVAPSFTGERVTDALEWLFRVNGAPEYLRSDNGSELICRHVQEWLREAKVKTLYITPGSPWENGRIESFHGKLRDECLNMEWFENRKEVQEVV